MGHILSDEALDALFRAARSPEAWLPQPVGEILLRALWELVKQGPGSALGPPPRLVFVSSEKPRARLAAAIPATLRPAISGAPVVAIVGLSRELRQLSCGQRQGPLCAAALILAARALGLDCRPVWQFDAAAVDAAFFPEAQIAADFVCAIGYGDNARLAPPDGQALIGAACVIL